MLLARRVIERTEPEIEQRLRAIGCGQLRSPFS